VKAPDSANVASLNVDPASQRGQVVAKVPVAVQRGRAHHTEYEHVSRTLLANLFEAGRTYLFDLRHTTNLLEFLQDAPRLSQW
jgi:hypothetical protein